MSRLQLLPPHHFEHFYRAGDHLTALRGGPAGPFRPEEWLASTTTRAGHDEQGLSRLADGRLLRDAIEADASGWLGADHVAAFGASSELLVKLLDAGERLPVHLHPNRSFSAVTSGSRTARPKPGSCSRRPKGPKCGWGSPRPCA